MFGAFLAMLGGIGLIGIAVASEHKQMYRTPSKANQEHLENLRQINYNFNQIALNNYDESGFPFKLSKWEQIRAKRRDGLLDCSVYDDLATIANNRPELFCDDKGYYIIENGQKKHVKGLWE